MAQDNSESNDTKIPEPFFPAIWSVLHDGYINSVKGKVPGTVSFEVHIEYLRTGFPDPGECFHVVLNDCTLCNYRDYDSESFLPLIENFPEQGIGILSAEQKAEKQLVWCDERVIEFVATEGELYVEDRKIELQELLEVATRYWDAFGSK